MTPDLTPTPTPATPIAHIVNPAQTQTKLGYTINGQPYSLEPGQSQDVELSTNEVIEFDRGSGNDTARYTLSDGAYTFASTPQGWELYHTSDAQPTDAVASN